ncbi:13328_t:CDS:1, partial [Ambispora leptoticha]
NYLTNLLCAPNPRIAVVTNQLTCYVRKDHSPTFTLMTNDRSNLNQFTELEENLLLVVFEHNPPGFKRFQLPDPIDRKLKTIVVFEPNLPGFKKKNI